MAISFFKKKEEKELEKPIPAERPSMQPQIRNLTGSPFQPATEQLAIAEARGLRPARPSTPSVSEMPPAPVFRPAPRITEKKLTTEEIEEIAEAIISEKWQKVSKDIDELKHNQDDLSAALGGMQERMSNLEKKMDMVIKEVLGKVEEYGKGITDVGTELKAMQKVFGTIMPAFTENVKELQELVGTAKERGFKKRRRR